MRKAAALMIESGKLLVVKSKKNTDMWISPGGKYEGNESFLECLSRELQEELGVRMVDAKLYRTYHERAAFDNVALDLETYLVQYDGIPMIFGEIVEMRWVSPGEVRTGKINVASGLKKIIPDLVRDKYL